MPPLRTPIRLSSRLAHDFTNTVQNRGRDYFRWGRVHIVRGSDRELEARVTGTRRYHVQISFQEGTLASSCECSYSYSTGPCKHLWAAILAGEARGFLSAAAMAGPLEHMDILVPGDQDDEDDSVDDGDFHLTAPVPEWQPRASTWQPQKPRWREQIEDLGTRRMEARDRPFDKWNGRRQLVFVVNVPGTMQGNGLIIDLFTRDHRASGVGFTKMKEFKLPQKDVDRLPDPADREILGLLAGTRSSSGWYAATSELSPAYQLLSPLAEMIVRKMCDTGRCHLRSTPQLDGLLPLAWDDGEPWRLELDFGPRAGKQWGVTGVLCREGERLDLTAPVLLTAGGLAIFGQRVARLAADAPWDWIRYLRDRRSIEAPEKEKEELLGLLLEVRDVPRINAPVEVQYEERQGVPRPHIKFRAAGRSEWDGHLRASVAFDYGGRRVAEAVRTRGFRDTGQRIITLRDCAAEQAARARLESLGLKPIAPAYDDRDHTWKLAPAKLPGAVRALISEGWGVEAEGKTFRKPGPSKMQITSGIDWFELHGEVEYGETKASLPELIEALRRGDNMVKLDDGTFGILPEEWLSRLGPLVGLGTASSGHLRFHRTQAGVLDALLAARPEVRFDEGFARMRDQLRRFEGIRPAPQPETFRGELRDYQREGLGWMNFLREFGFGGCLADDMGVGKTAQVLALLESRRGEKAAPSLAVVPRSLVFNWRQEAEKFTPGLRVLDHTGIGRDIRQFDQYDLILTTYGTLRRDVALFQDLEFEYVILDEAQAIKNADTDSAKAARLLNGRHRLALSGTPVENHLGELWSLFEFLNPGMLGSASVFKLAGGASRNPDEETRKLLAHALRPFILRRTKDQVARELPEKTEQTIYCELEPEQRRLYDEMREHYRNTLLARVDQNGLAKSKILVLEALLRLRQAACHPGLLDAKRTREPAAKIDFLIDRLATVIEEGRKTLVFSQFTSLLKIVRARLDEQKIPYEYLDGATRDRQERVERFQNDPACPLFLISLKAGGLGLNLTAAEYVFLLDPWWNPAVEAQAIDRTHRIGQQRRVFAYRIIARGTVEEKVLELQQHKRKLADAIIGADNSLIRDLAREDLELLLS